MGDNDSDLGASRASIGNDSETNATNGLGASQIDSSPCSDTSEPASDQSRTETFARSAIATLVSEARTVFLRQLASYGAASKAAEDAFNNAAQIFTSAIEAERAAFDSEREQFAQLISDTCMLVAQSEKNVRDGIERVETLSREVSELAIRLAMASRNNPNENRS